MIRLRTFGGVDLKDSGGDELRSLLTQPKRVALLAYLALANSSGFRRRDTVVSLLWPDLDEAHARSALRQALTFLRRTLGDGVVVTRGEEEIGVDAALLECDAVAFRRAYGASRFEDAMSLYHGDFLDGFHVTDAAPEFQMWVEGERSELRQGAADSAWALAEGARRVGNRTAAVALARKAAAFAPDDEGCLTRLIVFLDDVGDRAGAISTYEEFAERLKQEYEAEPAPETQSLIQRVRARRLPSENLVTASASPLPPPHGEDTDARPESPSARVLAGAPAGTRASIQSRSLLFLSIGGLIAIGGYLVAFTDRLRETDWARYTVAVLPLQDLSGDTSRRYIANGLTDQLITELAQSAALRVINSRTMLLYRDSAATPRDVAQRLHADAVVFGTFQQVGDTAHVAIQLVRSRDERAVWGQTFSGTRADVLHIQGEVARMLIRRLRSDALPRLANTTNARPVRSEAIDLYVKGRFWWNERGRANLLKSIDLFTQALDVDPDFALAYSGMADAYVQLGYGSLLAPSDAFPKAKAAAHRALDLDSTLAEPHASLGFVEMYYDWNWLAAEREFKRALALNPSYATGHEWFGLFLSAMGRYKEALEQEAQAQDLDPLSAAVVGTQGWVLHYAGRQDDAEQTLKIALRMSPAFSLGHLYLGRVHQAKGHLDSAMTEYAAVGPLRGWAPSIAGEGYVYGLLGKTSEARRTLAQMDSMSRAGQYVTAYAKAIVHVAMGEKDSAFVLLERGVRERTHWLVWLNRDRRWAPLQGDPRFATLVREVGLPP
jgi:DNA-binding SARP family transcriptional activator/TolB-like protein/Tfp pilus assembly protein PilF